MKYLTHVKVNDTGTHCLLIQKNTVKLLKSFNIILNESLSSHEIIYKLFFTNLIFNDSPFDNDFILKIGEGSLKNRSFKHFFILKTNNLIDKISVI